VAEADPADHGSCLRRLRHTPMGAGSRLCPRRASQEQSAASLGL
jgi:hypothetical protein